VYILIARGVLSSNDKCVEDIKNEPVVFPLIRTLNDLKGGQGLG
jgi:hypothetical protein